MNALVHGHADAVLFQSLRQQQAAGPRADHDHVQSLMLTHVCYSNPMVSKLVHAASNAASAWYTCTSQPRCPSQCAVVVARTPLSSISTSRAPRTAR